MIPSLSPALALSPALENLALAFALALPLAFNTIGFDALKGGGTFSTQL